VVGPVEAEVFLVWRHKKGVELTDRTVPTRGTCSWPRPITRWSSSPRTVAHMGRTAPAGALDLMASRACRRGADGPVVFETLADPARDPARPWLPDLLDDEVPPRAW